MSEKAEQARKKVAEALATQRAGERRRRAVVVSAVALVVLLIAAGIGIAVYRNDKPEKVVLPQGASRTGLTIGSAAAPITVDVYFDFQCPVCKQFETQSGSTLRKYVQQGTAKVVYHPVAYLDGMSSGTRYSTRASSAAGCAADAGKLPEFITTLFAHQPAEGGVGLTDAKIVTLARAAGISGSAFGKCVDDETYHGWTAALTDSASKAGVVATPTVKVDGRTLPTPTTAALSAAVSAAAGVR
jgi:protein-disulfide isomerase